MNRELRIGLIGFGKAGRLHAAAIRKSEDAQIAAIADPAPSAVQAAQELDVPRVARYEDLFTEVDIDAVVISLPHHLLHRAGLMAAEHGKHVLMEKPMGLTVTEATEVVHACSVAGVRLMVNFVHRFRAEYRQALAAVQSGAIGRIVMIVDMMASGRGDLPAWTMDPATSGGGLMIYGGIHSMDRLGWLAGSPIARVTAEMGTFCYPMDVEDNLVGTVVFQNGALGAVVNHRSNAVATLGGWQTSIYGTHGSIQVTSGHGLELLSDKERVILSIQHDDRFLGAFREFTAAIRDGRDPSPSGDDGVHALASVLALYDAARTGQVTAVQPEITIQH